MLGIAWGMRLRLGQMSWRRFQRKPLHFKTLTFWHLERRFFAGLRWQCSQGISWIRLSGSQENPRWWARFLGC